MKKWLPVFTSCILLMICTLTFGMVKVTEAKQAAPYQIKVNRSFNTITVYELDEEGKYTVPIKAMLCSVGANLTGSKGVTPKGSFHTSAKYRWKELYGKVYGQYATRITGNILFHSVYYYKNMRPDTLSTKQYNKLGSRASMGCIRLSCADAKWIYDNCPVGTNVVIYDDAVSAGPLGKPEAIKLPSSVTWDPTDPDEDNPYKDKKPKITGAKSKEIKAGVAFDPLKGVKAYSSLGSEITDKLTVKGEVDVNTAGMYKLKYCVTDVLGRTKNKTITITVNSDKIVPVIKGAKDRVISGNREVTDSYALSGVKAYFGTIEFEKDEIEVHIKNIDELTYQITYKVTGKNGLEASQTATFYVDNEAPVVEGLDDNMTFDEDTVIDKDYVTSLMKITDNYSDDDEVSTRIVIKTITEDVVFVTYDVSDAVGNTTTKRIQFVKE